MDVRILNKPSSAGLVLSSSLPDLQISSDCGAVRVALQCDYDVFYQAVFYPYAGLISVPDFASVIESYFRRRGWFRHHVRMAAGWVGDSTVCDFVEFECLFCEVAVSGFDVRSAFLTPALVRRVPPSAVVDLYSCGILDDESVSVYLSGTDAAGLPASEEISLYASSGCVSLDFPWLAEHWRSHGFGQLQMVVVRDGDSAVSFAIDPSPGWIEFRFRNCFNCPESLFIQGTVSLDPECARSTAVCAGKVTLYDVHPEWSYSLEAGSLSSAETEPLAMMLLSHDVELMVGGVAYPVVITSSSAKFSTDDSQIPSAKFSWMFTDRRPRFTADAGGFGIFTREFTDPFQ